MGWEFVIAGEHPPLFSLNHLPPSVTVNCRNHLPPRLARRFLRVENLPYVAT